MKGLIIKSTGSWYKVLDLETQKIYEARARGKFKLLQTKLTNPISVGDFVNFQIEFNDLAWITEILPRKNYLIRKSVNLSKEAHIIASNIDLACFIFILKNPETSLGFLDRFLVCCEAYNIQPLILFNKIDLLSEEEISIINQIKEKYTQIGYDSLNISAKTMHNIDVLKDRLKDKISVFFGHSGCGKSTLVHSIQPTITLKTGEISESNFKGKHTTTFAQMFFWDFGGSVIDTPGVREFGMIDFDKNEIQDYFPEIFTLKEDCKYHNCLHINEPKCAIQKALESEEIQQSRYATYLKLIEETKN